jgi:hypothetical protein
MLPSSDGALTYSPDTQRLAVRRPSHAYPLSIRSIQLTPEE